MYTERITACRHLKLCWLSPQRRWCCSRRTTPYLLAYSKHKFLCVSDFSMFSAKSFIIQALFQALGTKLIRDRTQDISMFGPLQFIAYYCHTFSSTQITSYQGHLPLFGCKESVSEVFVIVLSKIHVQAQVYSQKL